MLPPCPKPELPKNAKLSTTAIETIGFIVLAVLIVAIILGLYISLIKRKAEKLHRQHVDALESGESTYSHAPVENNDFRVYGLTWPLY
ncbi:hypothetical protein NEPAR06_1336 [Nematocida parisii]|uniref:Uncharacterized protein n=1 Tax=Nematocida parisii (strain ERTm3) TaxID=935791 RepID=I3EDN2_NEMP3|nr:uncharacterized protein NEPG_01546 [Nematocida parisii ERTm1]EIJ87329.1 hypothetical protein NEQG_02452 [Nematocida parisii ERTm3]KAI5129194.1 hypothetical protein NEPAR08_1488 [Nematocida parisii]EIJ93974.1 hypothetical protein NEPG_01546 [Nematocida parisii ERTm1]KAI5130160.1 hypothetical protein NEPAR03_1981 [Nematocida parisii]KAI5143727.1 hypothetical protein NEPAR04_1923 [Nematocida parisii]|eukprot:XP_013059374.1 hypothetical protein NEPG_01546 [Nematocida parisii ERTm1]